MNDTIPAQLKPKAIEDYDNDTIPDLLVKFDRAKITTHILNSIDINVEEEFINITLTITGKLNNGTPFQGSCTIRVIHKGIYERLMAKMFRYEAYMQ